MEINNIKSIEDKFKELREKEADVFDFSKLENNEFRRKEDILFDSYYTFSNNLEKEINSLPESNYTVELLIRWIDNLDYWIKSKNGAKLSETTKAHLKFRKELKSKLIEIARPLQAKAIADIESKVEIAKSENSEKLTIKQQILLLKALGIVDKKEIKGLHNTKKAKLFSHLLNRSVKNVKDYLTYIDKKNAPADFFIYKDDNVKKINELLESIDLQEYLIEL